MNERLASYYEDFKDSIGDPLHGASTTLSTRGNKQVELRETREGEKYVLRRYTTSAMRQIAGRPSTFVRKLTEAKEDFEASGLKLVEHQLIEDPDSETYPIAIIADYVDNLQNLKGAQTSTKRRVAQALGNLAVDPDEKNNIFIGASMVMPDMFHVETDTNGEETVVLVDLDPRVTETDYQPTILRNAMMAASVLRTADVFWDMWLNEGEYRTVMPGLTIESARALDLDSGIGDQLFDAVAMVNLMDNGLDYRLR